MAARAALRSQRAQFRHPGIHAAHRRRPTRCSRTRIPSSDGAMHPGDAPGLGVDIDEALAATLSLRSRVSAGQPQTGRDGALMVTRRAFLATSRVRSYLATVLTAADQCPLVEPDRRGATRRVHAIRLRGDHLGQRADAGDGRHRGGRLPRHPAARRSVRAVRRPSRGPARGAREASPRRSSRSRAATSRSIRRASATSWRRTSRHAQFVRDAGGLLPAGDRRTAEGPADRGRRLPASRPPDDRAREAHRRRSACRSSITIT